jgi:hypothetical protein
MPLEPVPDLYPVGARVRTFPDVRGTVVAIEDQQRVVETAAGVRHTVSTSALVSDE